MRRCRHALAALALSAACGRSGPDGGAPTGKFLRVAEPAPGRYVVVLRDGAAAALTSNGTLDLEAVAGGMVQRHRGRLDRVYRSALRGFAAELSEEEALRLSADPDVDFVEEDGIVRALDVQASPPSWGLDRIDQAAGLDGAYAYARRGLGVHAYVVDTGIRTTHVDFQGRASAAFSAVSDGYEAQDCEGHGTHVAGTIGGATFGVAKGVRLHSVRVLACDGTGYTSWVIAGVDWVTANHESPAVANMSLGGGVQPALDLAVRNSVAAGVTYAVAAGNDAEDACGGSPARAAEAITAGATEWARWLPASPDRLAYFSNFGRCVDLLAPGVSITSAGNGWDGASAVKSGTSMASPHVAGAAALYLEANPSATPAEVARALAATATAGAVGQVPATTPNLLLYTGFLPGGDGAPPVVSLVAPAAGAELQGVVAFEAAVTPGDAPVSEVDFWLDGRWLGAARAPPWQLAWDSAEADNGPHLVEAAAFDAAWRSSARSAVPVRVQNRGRAAFDPAFATPSCRAVEARCFTGPLVAGRGPFGEPNAPNTLHGACPDGAYGGWLEGASVERLEIASEGGGPLAAGTTVLVRAGWLANAAGDEIELYTAADAAAPMWAPRGAVAAAAAGSVATEWRFALPPGDWQVVRAAYRSRMRTDASAPPHAPCTLDFYDDRDDLVFAVGDGVPDATPPWVVVTGPSVAGTGLVALRADAGDDRGVRRVAFEVDGLAVGDALAPPWEATWQAAAPGKFQVVARAWDAAGNEGLSPPFQVQVGDASPPVVQITAPPAPPWSLRAVVKGVVEVAATAEDLGGGRVAQVDFLVDGALLATAVAAPYRASWDTDLVAEGEHALGAHAVDDSGNETTATATVMVDRTAPLVAFRSPVDGATVWGDVPLSFTASDAGGFATWQAQYYVDGQPMTRASGGAWNSRTVAPGPHVLTVRVPDLAGNVGEASIGVVVRDLGPPRVSLYAYPSSSGLVGVSPTLTASATDDVAVVRTELRLDGMLVALGTSSASWRWDASRAEGPHTVTGQAWDAAGNSQVAELSLEVDATPPSIAIASPAPGATLTGPLTVALDWSDAHGLSRTELLVDGRKVEARLATPFDISWDAGFATPGPHVLSVRAVDLVGNAATSADVAVEVVAPGAAAFDPALGVPRCADVGPVCRTGMLIAGVGSTEPNAPNTLGGTCPDTAWSGGWGIEAVEVATLDGTPLATGKPVRVRARASSPYVNVAVFAAADAFAPGWTLVGLAPGTGDRDWAEVPYVLPAGPSQAIRVVARSSVEPAPCSTWDDDHDDLVFAVAPP